MNLIEIIQIFSSLALFGLIWVIQILHYPSFQHIDERRFNQFHAFHTRKISFIVIPLMLSELATMIMLALQPPQGKTVATYILLAATIGIWLSTATLQVPCHHRLADGKDSDVIRRLVLTNWLRTLAWTLKAVILFWWLLSH